MTNVDHTSGGAEDLGSRQSEATIGLSDISHFLKFAWPYMLVATLVTMSVAGLYLMTETRIYTAATRLIFDPKTAPSFDPSTRWLEPSAEMTTRIESQVEVIKSEITARKVIGDLDLENDPEFLPRRGTLTRLFSLVSAAANPSAPVSTSKPAQTADIETIVPIFVGNLSVRRVGVSAVIEVAYSAQSPQKAATIANALATAYIEGAIKQKAEAALDGSIWLKDRLGELRKQAFDALLEVERFKAVGAGTVSDSTVRLAELESVAETYRRLYENFLLKFTETLQRVSYPVSDAYLITKASPSLVAVNPKRGTTLIFAAMAGLVLGAAFSFAKLSLDNTIRNPQAIAAADVRVLASIDREQRRALRVSGPNSRVSAFGSQAPSSLVDLLDKAALTQVRALKAAIDLSGERALRLIGVVGAGPGAGATTIAAKLAQSYAAAGRRVLLVDNNLTDRTLSTQLAPKGAPGLGEVLRGEVAWGEAVSDSSACGFTLLPADRSRNNANSPGVLLNEEAGRVFFESVGKVFDTCIFDLSPLAASAEAALVAHLMDAVIIVIECDTTRVDELKSSVKSLMTRRVNLLGAVLNKVPSNQPASSRA